MLAHGVSFTAPHKASLSSPLYRAAARACGGQFRHALEQLGSPAAPASEKATSRPAPPRPSRVSGELQLALQRFAACMRTHGVALPPPSGGVLDTSHLNKRSPTFKAALIACDGLLQAG